MMDNGFLVPKNFLNYTRERNKSAQTLTDEELIIIYRECKGRLMMFITDEVIDELINEKIAEKRDNKIEEILKK